MKNKPLKRLNKKRKVSPVHAPEYTPILRTDQNKRHCLIIQTVLWR